MSLDRDCGSSLHASVRAETAAVHARLHRHPGLAAVASQRIDLAGYRRLLLRLYGFYLPFEVSAGLEPVRSGWLASDLAVLAAPRRCDAISTRRAELPRLDSAAAKLGAMYVVEGSALGGRGLARNLHGLLGDDTLAGRRFFASDGADTGRVWRTFLDELGAVPAANRRIVIDSAVATFGSFETWMAGWEATDNA